MAGGGARIAEALAGNRNKFPVVAALAEGELENAPGFAVANLARWQRNGTEGTQARPTGADDKLAESAGGVGAAGGIHGSEAFVVVVVAGQDHVGASLPQNLPETLDRLKVAMHARAVARMVPDGECARRRILAQLGAQPLLLR